MSLRRELADHRFDRRSRVHYAGVLDRAEHRRGRTRLLHPWLLRANVNFLCDNGGVPVTGAKHMRGGIEAMRLWFGVLSAVVMAAVAAVAASPANAAPAVQSTSAKTCHIGYTLASFSWGQRCIRSGQYCKKVRNPEYHRYKFQCVNGKLRKQRGKGKA